MPSRGKQGKPMEIWVKIWIVKQIEHFEQNARQQALTWQWDWCVPVTERRPLYLEQRASGVEWREMVAEVKSHRALEAILIRTCSSQVVLGFLKVLSREWQPEWCFRKQQLWLLCTQQMEQMWKQRDQQRKVLQEEVYWIL